MNKKILGFTLIEMLVVVGIIAVLSVVALTSLGPAREKSRDTKIIAQVNQVRAIAEKVFNEENSFTNLSTSPLLTPISNAIREAGGNLEVYGEELKYCAKAKLVSKKDDSDLYYCVDSGGYAGNASSSVCSNTNIKCSSQ